VPIARSATGSVPVSSHWPIGLLRPKAVFVDGGVAQV
jgi:hypothetical protein